MSIKLCEQAFDPWREIASYQAGLASLAGKYGATGVFVGSMRDFNRGDGVKSMFLEHYPGMTEKQLQHIVEQAQAQWPILESLVMHRVGWVKPDDALVVVAVWSAQRGDAFDASRFIMENLKSRAPFWKKEVLASGAERWVEKNTDGYQRQPG
ncbi:molybdenum cofactor biosynthesis protein MoaE [Methylomonas rivi]|uniref:Molybdopterin synthase catalytic subunit n=1 Tax=Methylomonas rivi TaxID=2952226 RepID=A0ABT1U6Q2_9GAMM|nr:molybdenum cofactor biosynthesis protein MoaE [Methylomonas sp. WSC-6]MBS4051256.1 molybdenum cofactor biosynthesis protein MoaE [Methylomonas sp.]MCQ8129539.1 molybdenum cofactor biosynthesis protein MoaE [Methylomonas sp. WSC-6]